MRWSGCTHNLRETLFRSRVFSYLLWVILSQTYNKICSYLIINKKNWDSKRDTGIVTKTLNIFRHTSVYWPNKYFSIEKVRHSILLLLLLISMSEKFSRLATDFATALYCIFRFCFVGRYNQTYLYPNCQPNWSFFVSVQ